MPTYCKITVNNSNSFMFNRLHVLIRNLSINCIIYLIYKSLVRSWVKGQHGCWHIFIYREIVGFISGSYSFYCTFYCSLCCADVSEHCGQTWVLLVFLEQTFMVQLDKFTFWTDLHFDLAGHFCLPVPTYRRLTVVTVQWFSAVPASAYRLN